MLIVPSPLPRGLYVTGFYLYSRMLVVYAVTSTHQCIRHLYVASQADLEAAATSLARELDDADPLPSAPPPVPRRAGRLLQVMR